MSTTLPELPKAAAYATQIKEGRVLFEPRASFNVRGHVPLFTADQLHAYGLAVWKAAVEEAATAVNTKFLQPRSMSHAEAVHNIAVRECLDAIRSLPLPEQGSPQ